MQSMPVHRGESGVHSEDPLRLIPRALTKLYTLWLSVTYPFASKGHNLSIHYTCNLRREVAHRIKLGSSIIIGKDAWLHVSAPPGENGEPVIVIEDNNRIGPRCQISGKNCIHLERDVILSSSVLVMDHSHAYEDITVPIAEQGATEGGRIRIGQGSWIGFGAAIICDKGELVLGRNSVVGANAVVTRSCPPYSVLLGNPARVVKQYDPVKGDWALGSVRSARTGLRDEGIAPPGSCDPGVPSS
jgi:acetyltransferase-like isoleucine patch superfamily enzyme